MHRGVAAVVGFILLLLAVTSFVPQMLIVLGLAGCGFTMIGATGWPEPRLSLGAEVVVVVLLSGIAVALTGFVAYLV